jgi:hypothetical protein
LRRYEQLLRPHIVGKQQSAVRFASSCGNKCLSDAHGRKIRNRP